MRFSLFVFQKKIFVFICQQMFVQSFHLIDFVSFFFLDDATPISWKIPCFSIGTFFYQNRESFGTSTLFDNVAPDSWKLCMVFFLYWNSSMKTISWGSLKHWSDSIYLRVTGSQTVKCMCVCLRKHFINKVSHRT